MSPIDSIMLASFLVAASVIGGALIADAISTLMGWKK